MGKGEGQTGEERSMLSEDEGEAWVVGSGSVRTEGMTMGRKVGLEAGRSRCELAVHMEIQR